VKRLAGDITERSAYIIWHGYKIATITERMNDATEIEYIIRVNWDVYDASKCDDMIAGIDMDLRLPEYIRDHYPSFVVQRTPPKGREDVPYTLKRLGLTCYDRWDIMCKNHGKTSDEFEVEEILN